LTDPTNNYRQPVAKADEAGSSEPVSKETSMTNETHGLSGNRSSTQRRVRRAATPTLAALLLAAVLTACTASGTETAQSGSQANTPVSGGTLRNGVSDPGTDLDPVTVASAGGTEIVDTVTERLVQIDANNKAIPALATTWTPSENGLTWKVTIRPHVQFNNGKPLTPADVVATFDRLIAADSTSPAKGALGPVLKSVKADPDGTAVDFHLLSPFSDFPFLLSGNNTNILPANYKSGTWTHTFVGTGAFVITNYQPGQSVTFKRNPHYWNSDHIYLAGISTKIFKDQQSEVLALQSGEIDGLYGEAISTNLTSALSSSNYAVTSSASSGFEAFALRVDQAPFNDVKVRQAIAWAVDRDALIETVDGGLASLGNDTVFGPTHPVKPQGLTQRKADPTKVSELLGDRKIAFTITASSPDQQEALVIQQQLNKLPNFDIKVDIQSPSEYYAPGTDSPWLNASATLTGWASRPSPSQFYNNLYRTGAEWNASHYSNPLADKLASEYDASTDSNKRQIIVDHLAKIQNDDVPVIITAFQKSRYYLSKKLHMQLLPNNVTYTDAWLSE
jgi:peptide/nickel transport system substrate-binding protein